MGGRDLGPGSAVATLAPDHTMTSDASNLAGGPPGASTVSGQWSDEEAQSHINVKELMAVHKALSAWAPELRGFTVVVYVDNRTVVAYIRNKGGTRSRHLCDAARRLLALADRWAIQLCPAYLPGRANLAADALSRGTTAQEWVLSQETADQLFALWGIRTQIYSPHACRPSSAGTTPQTGQIRGQQEGRLLVPVASEGLRLPPPQLVPQVLAKAHQDGTRLILVTPYWEDASFLPEILACLQDAPRRLPTRRYRWAPTDHPSRSRRACAWHGCAGPAGNQPGSLPAHGRLHRRLPPPSVGQGLPAGVENVGRLGQTQRVEILSPTVGQVLDFLHHLFDDRDMRYASVGLYRSMLSTLLSAAQPSPWAHTLISGS